MSEIGPARTGDGSSSGGGRGGRGGAGVCCCCAAAMLVAATGAAGGCGASMLDVVWAVPDRPGLRFEPVGHGGGVHGMSVPYGQWEYGRWTYE